MKATSFVFERASFHGKERRADFSYVVTFADHKPLRFKESLSFPKGKIQKLPPKLLAELVKNLHLVLGVSYYKLYCPRVLKTPYALTKNEAAFWTTLYQKGLGEFFFRNHIDFRPLGRFTASAKAKPHLPEHIPVKEAALLGIGGGKDSIVAGELLKKRKVPLTAFVVETEKDSPVVSAVIKAMAIPKLVVKRALDPQLFSPPAGAFNGHVPISAVFAFVGTFAAALYGYRYVVVGNEASSNFGNVNYLGASINHQWSKSAEFEAALQLHTRSTLTPSVTYFSALRHLYEIRIAEAFTAYPKYFPIFTSCNRNFRVHHARPGDLWCGECPKCAFVFAMFAAFLSPTRLLPIFGKNLFETESLLPLFKDLAGLGKLKPFDCVGTFEETRAALRLASKSWGKTTVVKTLLPLLKKRFPKDDDSALFKAQNAPTLPAHFKFLGLKNVLLLGYGKEGQVTARYLKKFYPDLPVTLADQAKNPHYLDLQKNAEFAIRTPGLPKQKVTLPYTTATNIFFAQSQNFSIGVTGSKGKSTTASLTAHFLKAGGLDVELLGNIGSPMLEVLLKPTRPHRIYVLELSSYQLDDCNASPDIAVVTNLFPEHMNYHGGVEPYYAAKKNIFLHQNPTGILIYDPKHPLLKKWAKETPGQTTPFSTWAPAESPLLGAHNRSNVAAAIAAVTLFNLSKANLTAALKSFQPLRHRLQKVGTFRGITFYDDAISTSPESTIQAIEALTPLAPIGTIFLGGEDRGYDFTQLEKTLRRFKIKNIVLFPDTGKRILKSRAGFNVYEAHSLKEAVKLGYQLTPPGTLCVLSTASPHAFHMNFEDRGDEFQRLVKRAGA